MTRRAGVVVRAGARTMFVPGLAVARVSELPAVVRVPGAPAALAGIVDSEGEIVPVVDLRDSRDAASVLVVCSHMGEPLGLIASEVVGIGHYDVDPRRPDTVLVGDAGVAALDLARVHASLGRG